MLEKYDTIVDTFVIYSDYGTGNIDWSKPIDQLPATASDWQSPVRFGNGKEIQFVVCSVNREGIISPDSTVITAVAQLPGDFNSDGKIDILDLSDFAKAFGKNAQDNDWTNQYLKFKLNTTANPSAIDKTDVIELMQRFKRFLSLK